MTGRLGDGDDRDQRGNEQQQLSHAVPAKLSADVRASSR